jgi:hypothetical protein
MCDPSAHREGKGKGIHAGTQLAYLRTGTLNSRSLPWQAGRELAVEISAAASCHM